MRIFQPGAGSMLTMLLAASLLCGLTPANASADLSADEIVAAADAHRNSWQEYVVDVEITNYKADEVDSVNVYEVSRKGGDRSLVKFANPRDRGKYLLTADEAMWLYLPTSSRPIRVTPMQRLSGSASNGDVAQTDFAESYSATLVGEEELDGRTAFVLELVAKKKSATYRSIRYWVDKDELMPIQADLRLASNKPSKRALFESFQTIGGQSFLHTMTIVDLLKKDRRSHLTYTNFVQRELPDRIFNKNYLGQL